MKATYNVTGAARKELVKVIGSTLGTKPVYKFMPTCAFEIGAITVEKDGTMVWDERTNEATIQAVIAALAAAGFTAEIEGMAAPEAEGLQEAAHEAGDAEKTDDAEEGDRLTIALPKDGFTDGAIENLRKLVESKATLIKKALGADRITIDTDGDRVSFPWWDRQPEPEETQSYMAFLTALCKMAKEAKRVTAKETEVESEKYAFRCFLLRLGFIGKEYKEDRKLLLKNFTGSSAFKNGERKVKCDAVSE